MSPERAFKILETTRSTAKSIDLYKAQLEKAKKKLELHESQKLTATYGKERVKGGKQSNSIEDAVIRAESNLIYYQKKYDDVMELQRNADTIIRAMPKKTWKLANYYYRKAWTVAHICRFKHWSSRNSWYKWLAKYEQIVTETLTKK